MAISLSNGLTIGNITMESVPPNIVFFTYTTSTTSTITIPSTAQAGDLAVLFDNGITIGSTPTDVIPSTWTGTGTTNNPSGRMRTSYKILTSGDPGATITGMTATTIRKNMIIFRPAGYNITSLSAVQNLTQPTSGSWSTLSASPTITTSSATRPAIAFAWWYSAGTPTITANINYIDSGSPGTVIGYKIFNLTDSLSNITTSATGTTYLGYQTYYYNINIS